MRRVRHHGTGRGQTVSLGEHEGCALRALLPGIEEARRAQKVRVRGSLQGLHADVSAADAAAEEAHPVCRKGLIHLPADLVGRRRDHQSKPLPRGLQNGIGSSKFHRITYSKKRLAVSKPQFL